MLNFTHTHIHQTKQTIQKHPLTMLSTDDGIDDMLATLATDDEGIDDMLARLLSTDDESIDDISNAIYCWWYW